MRLISLLFVAVLLLARSAWAATPLDSLSPASPLSTTDTLPVCQTAAGCGATNSLLYLPMWQLKSWAVAPYFALTAQSGAQVAVASGGSGSSCTVASPCTLAQAQTNAQSASGAGKIIYLRGNGSAYLLSPSTSNACALLGTAAINLGSSDAGEIWATYPGDSEAVLNGTTSTATAMTAAYASSASLSGTTLTLGGTVQGTWATGMTVYPANAGGVVIQSGGPTTWTVLNPNSVSFSSTQAIGTNAVPFAFQACFPSNAYTNITFYGLKIQHFTWSAIWANHIQYVVEGNEFTDDGNSVVYPNDSAAAMFSQSWGLKFIHNYIHDVNAEGVQIQTAVGDNYGTVIGNNAIINTCIQPSGDTGSYCDSGGVQVEGDSSTSQSAGTINIVNNYIQDVYKAGAGAGADGGQCIYTDGYSWDVNIFGNVCTGYHGVNVLNNASQNIHVLGNIFSLWNNSTYILRYQNAGATANPQTGNVIENNLIVGNYAGSAGAGWQTDPSGLNAMPTVQDNYYWNLAQQGNLVDNACTGQCGSGSVLDQYPIYGSVTPHCWGAILAAATAAYATTGISGSGPPVSPAAYPQQPATWDTPGFWGPPGWTIPQTGTAPVWDTTGGDGVACTTAN